MRGKFILTTALAGAMGLVLSAGSALAAPSGWTNSLQKARDAAKEHDRAILVNFTGSNWCGWCMKLKKEVFSTDEFKKWARDNVVLLELDFPRPDNQSPAIKKQNQAMLEKYGVRGFPTVLFIEQDGTLIGRTGYLDGGPTKWVANAQAILKDRPKPAELELADSLDKGIEKAKSSGRPLLLIAAEKSAESRLKPIVTDEKFIEYANARFVNVHVELSDKLPADVAKVVEDYGLTSGPVLLAALDVEKTEAHWQSNQTPSPSKLMAEMEKDLPPIPYGGEWIEDFGRAQLIAASQKRPMMLDFTGSDWCGWCKKLDAEVFSTDAFKSYAKENLVLVKLDFPRRIKQSVDLKRQNRALLLKHEVRGFPTLVLLDPSGKKLGTMGYMEGGPDAFLPKLKETLAGR